MAAAPALITLEPAAVDSPCSWLLAARAAKAIRPASLLQSSLTVLLGAIEPLELKEGEALLKLDAAARHERTGSYVPVYAVKLSGAE